MEMKKKQKWKKGVGCKKGKRGDAVSCPQVPVIPVRIEYEIVKYKNSKNSLFTFIIGIISLIKQYYIYKA